jgi:hypothetical protein
MGTTPTSTGLTVDGFVTAGLGGASTMESTLETKMNALMGGEEITNQELIVIQYEMSKYQTYMTTMNNTVQSIQNQTKEMAKSIH